MAPLFDQQTFINDLLAFHKSVFGDARMDGTEDQESQGAPPEGGEEQTPEGQNDEGNESDEGTEGDKPKGPSEDDLPEWARKELKKARGEAANYRTRLRDTEDLLSKAKTPEEYEAAVGELTESNRKLERAVLVSQVARKFELPDELADVLKGDDEAALVEHAKVLAKFAGSTEDPELGGGLDPNNTDTEGLDPRKLARRQPRR